MLCQIWETLFESALESSIVCRGEDQGGKSKKVMVIFKGKVEYLGDIADDGL